MFQQKMSVSTTIFVIISSTFLFACNSPSSDICDEPGVSCLNPNDMIGIWEEYSFAAEYDTFRIHKTTVHDEQWKFTEDSLYIIHYPNTVVYDLKWEVDGNQMFLSGFDTLDYYWLLNCNFYSETEADTLRIRQETSNSHGKWTTYRNYLKTEKSEASINKLICDRIDWSQFERKWYLLEYVDEEIIARDSIYNLMHPDSIDLSISNSSNFHVSRDTLFYRDTNGKHKFLFLNRLCPHTCGMALQYIVPQYPGVLVLVYNDYYD
jgi:hypothetical protein